MCGVIGALAHSLTMKDDSAEVLKTLIDPSTRIVTLTITEKGYGADLHTKKIDLNVSDVAHDLQNPDVTPRSIAGLLVRTIAIRAANKTPQFTCLSCDNLPKNGALLRVVLVGFAEVAGLTDVVNEIVGMSFPSTMVDRAKPVLTAQDAEKLQKTHGYSDPRMVVAEPFFQWVIEDDFPAGRPKWENVGAEFAQDVTCHELMKLRMRNGSHSILAAIGQTADPQTIFQSVYLRQIQLFFACYWSEVGTTMIGDLDINSYASKLLERFQNPSLEHRVDQIASDVSKKIPQRLVAPLNDLNGKSEALALWIAIVIRACGSHNELGQEIHFSDPEIGSNIPRTWFDKTSNLAAVIQFVGPIKGVEKIAFWLERLLSNGLKTPLGHFNLNNCQEK